MQTLLTPEDSKRVADALIAKIDDANFDVAFTVADAISRVVMPYTANNWKKDWFPLCIEEMCDEIRRGVVNAAYEAAEKISK